MADWEVRLMTGLYNMITIIVIILSALSLYYVITNIDFSELTGCHQSVCSWEVSND